MQLAGWSVHVFSGHFIDYRGTCISGPLKLDGEVPQLSQDGHIGAWQAKLERCKMRICVSFFDMSVACNQF